MARVQSIPNNAIDMPLLLGVLSLLAIGSLMIVSTSLPYAENNLAYSPFHFVQRHFIYIALALVAAYVTLGIRIELWQKYGPYLLVLSIVLLVAVLFVGRTVNGSKRWIVVGPITLQVSELAKLFVITYIAGYLVRRSDELQTRFQGFMRPLLVVCLITILLFAQPDFGAAAVIAATTMAMLFLAGARLWQFILLVLGVGFALAAVLVNQEYRLERLITFLNPWQDPFGSGYQLIQSLIAYGRGEWFGEGLGNSVQKLAYLPEAHTDFVFAILAEEFGFIGVVLVVMLFAYIFVRGMKIARTALLNGNAYAAYLAYGISIWIVMQALVNIGVSSGALPTKGLTLPFISYGGSSLIVSAVAVAILLRVQFEIATQSKGLKKIKQKEAVA